MNDPTATEATELVHIGWYCWRCRGIVEQACRSDNVPVHVPAEWVGEMRAELWRLAHEEEGR